MDTKEKNILAITLGLALVVLSNFIGHFVELFSIFITPVLLTIIIARINASLYKSNFLLTIIYNFGLLLFNDLFIRFYAGGTHDQISKTWTSLFFAIAFVVAFITMVFFIFRPVDVKVEASKTKILSTNISALLILTTLTGLLYVYVIADI